MHAVLEPEENWSTSVVNAFNLGQRKRINLLPDKELRHPILAERYCKHQLTQTPSRFYHNHPYYLVLPDWMKDKILHYSLLFSFVTRKKHKLFKEWMSHRGPCISESPKYTFLKVVKQTSSAVKDDKKSFPLFLFSHQVRLNIPSSLYFCNWSWQNS